MGRTPMLSKDGLTKGTWTSSEDKILTEFIKLHGQGNWRNISKLSGLKRSGKSCRLRWMNYLRPDIKRGNISPEEEDLIIRLHKLLGNRWSLIAGRLPGRTDNEVKNYWNTTLSKKLNGNKQLHVQHLDQSTEEINNSSKLQYPTEQQQQQQQQLQKKRSCKCINEGAGAPQDKAPNKVHAVSLNIGEDNHDDDDGLGCVASGSISPVLSEEPIPFDNITWDFGFDEFLLSDLFHLE